MIGGNGFVRSWFGADELGVRDAADIATYLDEPRQVLGVATMCRQWHQHRETGDRGPVLDAAGGQAWRGRAALLVVAAG